MHIPIDQSYHTSLTGLFHQKRCPKGRSCNFLHVFKNPDRRFFYADKDLFLNSHSRVNGDRWMSVSVAVRCLPRGSWDTVYLNFYITAFLALHGSEVCSQGYKSIRYSHSRNHTSWNNNFQWILSVETEFTFLHGMCSFYHCLLVPCHLLYCYRVQELKISFILALPYLWLKFLMLYSCLRGYYLLQLLHR